MRRDGAIAMWGHCYGTIAKNGRWPFAAVALVILCGAILTIGSSEPAQALPSFARQTGQPCGTCHTDRRLAFAHKIAGSGNAALLPVERSERFRVARIGGRARGAFARKLRAAGSNICVIVMGYSTDAKNVQEMYQAGADSFISMSTNNEELVNRILVSRRNQTVCDFSITASYDRLAIMPGN